VLDKLKDFDYRMIRKVLLPPNEDCVDAAQSMMCGLPDYHCVITAYNTLNFPWQTFQSTPPNPCIIQRVPPL